MNSYFVISKGKFTKHYFDGASRVVSKLGNGVFRQPIGITAGGVNYTKLTEAQQKALDEYIRKLGVPPGPPTQQGIYGTPEYTGMPYPSLTLEEVKESQEPPQGWPRNPRFNEKGDVPGPPAQFGPPVSPEKVEAGEGFVGTGLPEQNIYYLHSDHLGSTSYITTQNGSISQHVEYMAFGEVLYEEHSSSFVSPYLYNAKELDRDTNLYYYGARYYDPKVSVFLNVDPLAEQTMEPYAYVGNNPVMFVDPTGMASEGIDHIVPRYYAYTVSGANISFNKFSSNFQSSVNDVMKSNIGDKFFSNFMKKGEAFGGKIAESDGKYSNIKLEFWEINDTKTKGHYWVAWGAEGYLTPSIDANGVLSFKIGLDPKYSQETIAESILHEITIHGQHIDDTVNYYNKNGADKTKQYLKNNKKEDFDHKALRDKDMSNKGYEQYSKGKTEMIKRNKNYNKTFNNADKKYSNNYRNL